MRSEEHTSELQSRTLISYAVFCLKKKKEVERELGLSEGTVRNYLSESIGKLLVANCIPAARFFFFNDTASTEIHTSVHTLSLHDALPIYLRTEVTDSALAELLHQIDRIRTE